MQDSTGTHDTCRTSSDAFIANGSSAWKLPNIEELPEIHPHFVTEEQKYKYTPYKRDPETLARYWAIPGTEGYTHILGGLEKDGETGSISTDPENHDKMDRLRWDKVARIPVPDLKVLGDEKDADLLMWASEVVMVTSIQQWKSCVQKDIRLLWHSSSM